MDKLALKFMKTFAIQTDIGGGEFVFIVAAESETAALKLIPSGNRGPYPRCEELPLVASGEPRVIWDHCAPHDMD